MSTIALPVTEREYNLFNKVKEGTVDSFYFRIESYPETLFLQCHGSKEGMLQIKGQLLDPSCAVDLVFDKIQQTGVNELYIIACHGGLIKDFEYRGISVKSIHPSIEEIKTIAMPLLDGGYDLSITY